MNYSEYKRNQNNIDYKLVFHKPEHRSSFVTKCRCYKENIVVHDVTVECELYINDTKHSLELISETNCQCCQSAEAPHFTMLVCSTDKLIDLLYNESVTDDNVATQLAEAKELNTQIDTEEKLFDLYYFFLDAIDVNVFDFLDREHSDFVNDYEIDELGFATLKQ